MDLKERQIFNYYKNIIENNEFTEREIYVFLILMRSYIYDNGLNCIREFADLIAHRKRNKGLIQKAMRKAIDNKYKMLGNSKVKGYNGINNIQWEKEWKKLAKDNGIKLSTKTLREITLCIFSLAQNSKCYYEDSNKKNKLGNLIGKIVLVADSKNGSIGLATTEGHKDSLLILFAVYDGYRINKNYNIYEALTRKVSITCRENGQLKLKYKDKVIVENVM